MNKKDLSERDICSKFIGPAIKRAGWDGMMQIREEVAFTKGRIIVRGKLVTRGKAKRADEIKVLDWQLLDLCYDLGSAI
jgi:type I restriction enzyme, R subunit